MGYPLGMLVFNMLRIFICLHHIDRYHIELGRERVFDRAMQAFCILPCE